MPKLLIDGDGILYRCGFAVEKTKYLVVDDSGKPQYFDNAKDAQAEFDPTSYEIWSRKQLEPIENALYLVNNIMDKLTGKYRGYEPEVWLTPSVGNFRDRLAVTHKYKGNREFTQRPKYYKEIVEYLSKNYGARFAHGQEADDELGIGATADPASIIVSYDKDLRQVPGKHYDWVKEEEFNVNKKEGTLCFYGQVLAGDTTDNIYGLRGVGPAKASKMLADCASSRDCWEVVLRAYRDQESEDRALENARLCWVRRKPNEIWEPPT